MDKNKARDIAGKYLTAVTKQYPIKQAWLFGSHAKGHQHADSDIDIALLVSGDYDLFDLQVDLMKLRRGIDLRIEPHPFTQEEFARSSLKEEIEKHGIEMDVAFYRAG